MKDCHPKANSAAKARPSRPNQAGPVLARNLSKKQGNNSPFGNGKSLRGGDINPNHGKTKVPG